MNEAQIHPMRRLLKYTRPFRLQLWMAVFFSAANKLVDLAPPLLIGAAIDLLVNQEQSFLSTFGVVDVRAQLWFLAGISAIVWGLESLFEYIYVLRWRNLAQSVQHAARMDTYEHVQTLEMGYFTDQSTGGLMSVLNDDVNQLERFLDVGINDIWQLLITAVVTGAWLVWAAPSIAWMTLLPMPLIIYGSIWMQRQLAPRYLEVRNKVGILNGQLSNNLSGIGTIKSYTAEEYEIGRISGLSNEYQETNRETIRYSAAFVPVIRMFILVGFIAILVYGGFLVLDGVLAVGVYSTMVFLTQRLLWPLTRLGTTLDLYQRAMASTDRIFKLLDTEPQIVGGEQQLPVKAVQGAIRFEDVQFAYENGQQIIHNLSIDIPAGHTVALVGSTGSGKSTIIKLLLQFYQAQRGNITIDGNAVTDLTLHDLRSSIGLVSQEVYLFHGSASENISYGTFGASFDQVVEAAKIGEAHEFITHLPDGYDTIVGERGQKLSGGQRQRISIARAVLKDPPILILDEATSSVDNETEAAIQRSMEKIAIGRTTIIIAHRLSTVRNADKIYVLEHGRVVEQGQHDELVAKNGTYADLWRIQTGERTGL